MKSIALAVDMYLAEYNDTFRPSDTDLEAGYLVSGCACCAVQSQVTRMQAMKRPLSSFQNRRFAVSFTLWACRRSCFDSKLVVPTGTFQPGFC